MEVSTSRTTRLRQSLQVGRGLPGFHLVSVYQIPGLNVFNHASIGVMPFAVRVKETATLTVRSHDGDALPPTRQHVVDGINCGLGFTGRSLIRFHRAYFAP